jgi:hypothetical protein
MSEPSSTAAAAPQAPIAPQATPAASPAPSPSSTSPPPRAGVISDAQFDNLPVDQRDNYARMRKGPDGGSEWVERAQLEAARTAPDTAPGTVHKIGDVEVTEQELRDYLTSKADAELRKASLPATAADYKAELPANFEMPGGIEFKIDEADPLLTSARAWAHTKGLDQGTFSEMVGLYASAKATEAAQFSAAHAAEIEKMGANGPMRVTALETWLRGIVGGDEAKQMKAMLVTAGIVKGMEKLQQRMSSQGVASFSQAHREPRDAPGRASDAEYAAMTSAQRLDYARGFDQRQFGGVNPNEYSSDQR